MVGYPKHLNTKEDYYFVKDTFPKEQWSKDWQALLDSVNDWFFVKELEQGEIGVSDDTHKIVIDDKDDAVKNYQYEYKANDKCKLFALGMTIAEVEQALA